MVAVTACIPFVIGAASFNNTLAWTSSAGGTNTISYTTCIPEPSSTALLGLGALGITLETFDEFDPALYREHRDSEAMENVAGQYRHNIKNKTGVWRDLAVRKRKTEVDGIIGQTIRQGEALGLKLPLNHRLMELIHEVEDGTRVMDPANFKEVGWSPA